METGSSFTCSQKPANYPYPDRDESAPHSCIIAVQLPYYIPNHASINQNIFQSNLIVPCMSVRSPANWFFVC